MAIDHSNLFSSNRKEQQENSKKRGNRFIDLTSKKYGRLLVSGKNEIRNRRTYWECHCDCGKSVWVRSSHLTNGLIKSCGCYQKEVLSEKAKREIDEGRSALVKKHGFSNHALYPIYGAMLNRCYNRKCESYSNYGARGIYVCQRWQGESGFVNFLEDMGVPGEGQSIDRKDNNGPYSPDNCRWTDNKTQSRNTRKNHLVKWDGREITLIQLSEECGINYKTLHKRIHYYGWPVERAATTPARKINSKGPVESRFYLGE